MAVEFVMAAVISNISELDGRMMSPMRRRTSVDRACMGDKSIGCWVPDGSSTVVSNSEITGATGGSSATMVPEYGVQWVKHIRFFEAKQFSRTSALPHAFQTPRRGDSVAIDVGRRFP